MKKSIFIAIATMGTLSVATWCAPAAILIPDGNPLGVTDTHTEISSITSITSVSVKLDISAAYNGDLYVYLRHGSDISILLNRTGRTASDSSGYGDQGFNVTLSDAAVGDIHTYQTTLIPPPGSKLTGSWQPDARTADPDAVTDASGRSAFLNVFNGMPAAGNWTLFIADLSKDDQNGVLNSWSLEIAGTTTVVPEPSTYLAGFFALGMLGIFAFRNGK